MNGWNRIGTRKAWTNGKVTIIKPEDKNTFRIVDKDDNDKWFDPRRFTTLYAAMKYADKLGAM